VFIVQAYQTSQYVMPRGGNFFGKWRNFFAGNSDGKMNVQISLRSEHPVYETKYTKISYEWQRKYITKSCLQQNYMEQI
jgi:hypothetical protein